jgi:hypothetical protein
MPAREITWSAWQDGLARRLVDDSPHRERFYEALEAFRQKANSKEIVHVCVWIPRNPTLIYIEIHHTGWKHYPCSVRALVSWDADNGQLASFESENRAVFARRGWGRFVDDLVGYEVPRYSDCGDPEKTTYC